MLNFFKLPTFHFQLIRYTVHLLCRITANITILDNNVKAFLSIFVVETFYFDFFYYTEGKYFLFIMWRVIFCYSCIKSFLCTYALCYALNINIFSFRISLPFVTFFWIQAFDNGRCWIEISFVTVGNFNPLKDFTQFNFTLG